MALFLNLTWRKFLNGLASEGGNILVLFFLILVMVGLLMAGIPDALRFLDISVGALIGLLGAKKFKENDDLE